MFKVSLPTSFPSSIGGFDLGGFNIGGFDPSSFNIGGFDPSSFNIGGFDPSSFNIGGSALRFGGAGQLPFDPYDIMIEAISEDFAFLGCDGSYGSGGESSAGSSAAPPITPASSAQGLNTDPNDPSHTLSSSAPPAIQKYKKEIEDASRETGVPADIIAATMWAESRGDPQESSTNKDGNEDVGLMQISQSTYNDVRSSQGGPELDVNDPAQNIRAGAWELRDKFQNNGNSWRNAFAAYRGMEDGQDYSYADAVLGFIQDLIDGRSLPDNGRW